MWKMILGIYGKKKSGKTSLIEKLVERLKKEYSVATIKHIPYKDFSMDERGKDTHRHKKAGASVVVASSPSETVFISKSLSFNRIVSHLDEFDCDIILVEGYSKEDIPKILVGNGKKEKDTIFQVEGGKNTRKKDIQKILEYIKKNIKKRWVSLKVNDSTIPLSQFPQEMIENTVMGLISPLKRVKDARKIEIKIEL